MKYWQLLGLFLSFSVFAGPFQLKNQQWKQTKQARILTFDVVLSHAEASIRIVPTDNALRVIETVTIEKQEQKSEDGSSYSFSSSSSTSSSLIIPVPYQDIDPYQFQQKRMQKTFTLTFPQGVKRQPRPEKNLYNDFSSLHEKLFKNFFKNDFFDKDFMPHSLKEFLKKSPLGNNPFTEQELNLIETRKVTENQDQVSLVLTLKKVRNSSFKIEQKENSVEISQDGLTDQLAPPEGVKPLKDFLGAEFSQKGTVLTLRYKKPLNDLPYSESDEFI